MIAELKRRCERAAAETGQGRDTASHLDRLAGQWQTKRGAASRSAGSSTTRRGANEKNADRLLYTHGESRPGLWATLHSMRNVEGTGSLRVHDWPPRA